MTHVGAAPRDSGLPGAEPAFFFAPGQIQKRTADWGLEGLEQRIGDAWRRFRDSSDAWLNVKRDVSPCTSRPWPWCVPLPVSQTNWRRRDTLRPKSHKLSETLIVT